MLFITSNMSSPQVSLTQGVMNGRINTTLSNFHYYSFQGMRYAKPPVGDLRFKDPQPLDPWSGSYDATRERSACAQSDVLLPKLIGEEDCLYINVFTPKIPSLFKAVQVLLPVMVWFHGGGYVDGFGSSELFGPDYIVEKNVVLVTMNYRLGILGFLNLGSQQVPGNAGLKDQVMALKWVKENIRHFGGDPDAVTIFGESAGGATGQFMMVSPMARGLFHKVISQSGSCLNHWIYTPDHINPFEKAVELTQIVDNKTRNPDEMLQILQNLPIEDLLINANRLRTFDEKMRDSAFTFIPTVEKEFPLQESFLTRSAWQLFHSGNFSKIPYISGYNAQDGIYYVEYSQKNKGHLENLNRNFQYVVPEDMNHPLNSVESIAIAKKIRDYYFKNKELNESTIYEYIDLYTDYAFLEKIKLTADLIRRFSQAPVYFYRFSFDGDLNSYKKRHNLQYKGACHLDDLGYLFREYNIDLTTEEGSKSSIVRKRMVEMWTNFAKTGNPTPEVNDLIPVIWETVTEREFKYLDIDGSLSMKRDPEKDRMLFWKNLYKNYTPLYI